MSKSLHAILLSFVVLSLVATAVVWKHDNLIFVSDADGYVKLADSLIKSRFLTFGLDGQIEIFRTPGFPFLLAISKILFGSYKSYIFFHIIYKAISIYLVYNLVVFLKKEERLALIAALLLAVDPVSNIFMFVLYSETTYAFILLVAIYLLFRYHSRRAVIVASILLGVLPFVRPIAVYFFPLVFVFFYVWKRQRIYFLLFFIPLAMVGGYLARNYLLVHRLEFSSVGISNTISCKIMPFFRYLNAHHMAGRPESSYGDYLKEKFSDYPNLSPDKKEKIQYEEGVRLVFQHPLTGFTFFLVDSIFVISKLTLNGNGAYYAILFWDWNGNELMPGLSSLSPSTILRGGVIVRVLLVKFFSSFISALFLILFVIGAWQERRTKEIFFFAVVIFYHLSLPVVNGSLSEARFKIPIMPLFVMYCAIGSMYLFRLGRSKVGDRSLTLWSSDGERRS